jgi:hypothetical protein
VTSLRHCATSEQNLSIVQKWPVPFRDPRRLVAAMRRATSGAGREIRPYGEHESILVPVDSPAEKPALP